MAARDDVVSLPQGEWTQITNGSATGDITLEVLDGSIEIKATTADSAPADDAVGATLRFSGAGWKESTLAEVFPGVSGLDSNAYLWGRPLYAHDGDAAARVRVSHA